MSRCAIQQGILSDMTVTMEQTQKGGQEESNMERTRNPVLVILARRRAWLAEPSCLFPTATPGGSFQKSSQHSAKHQNHFRTV